MVMIYPECQCFFHDVYPPDAGTHEILEIYHESSVKVGQRVQRRGTRRRRQGGLGGTREACKSSLVTCERARVLCLVTSLCLETVLFCVRQCACAHAHFRRVA